MQHAPRCRRTLAHVHRQPELLAERHVAVLPPRRHAVALPDSALPASAAHHVVQAAEAHELEEDLRPRRRGDSSLTFGWRRPRAIDLAVPFPAQRRLRPVRAVAEPLPQPLRPSVAGPTCGSRRPRRTPPRSARAPGAFFDRARGWNRRSARRRFPAAPSPPRRCPLARRRRSRRIIYTASCSVAATRNGAEPLRLLFSSCSCSRRNDFFIACEERGVVAFASAASSFFASGRRRGRRARGRRFGAGCRLRCSEIFIW